MHFSRVFHDFGLGALGFKALHPKALECMRLAFQPQAPQVRLGLRGFRASGFGAFRDKRPCWLDHAFLGACKALGSRTLRV